MTTTSTILRFVAEASADSPGGRVAAGTVMKWIDEAAAVVAHQWANKSPCVAASFGKIASRTPWWLVPWWRWKPAWPTRAPPA